ncbi:MAG TPA: RDD family protein [Acidobacteriaceae bacterium]|nr:RDD family protein [Acidobacteriaceae bacterium]
MSTSPSNVDLNLAADHTSDAPAWKHELNERLQATRARRGRRGADQPSLPEFDQFSKNDSRASRLAAKVAERYANAPSYKEILAADARAAAAAAEAAVAAAQQACAAAQTLLAGLEPAGEQARPEPALKAVVKDIHSPDQNRRGSESQALASDAARGQAWSPAHESAPHSGFDSLEDAIVAPAQPLPVNLIEFPRELVATRKARPRLAEGPLREDLQDAGQAEAQLRIFEVEAENISRAVKIDAAVSDWSSIRLDAQPASLAGQEHSSALELPLQAAPLEDRLMAGIFDLALVALAFVVFVIVFAACTAHPPTGKPAWVAAGVVLAGLFFLYQYIFFRFTEGTPGMRYAKIALCTFDDENPTRKAMRRRILFLLLSAAPLGLGFAWAWFDTDRLGWHDRLTRMYQRSYRS